MTPSEIDAVLGFWFEELSARAWFSLTDAVDAGIRARFMSLYERLRDLPVERIATPRGCLAAIIVLDQCPRNMFRGSAQAYASDERALAIAEHAIAQGFDRVLPAQQRMFLYMPFQHSEAAAVQARSMELFTQLDEANALDYARQHRDIIVRFGRFPHRNAALGRASTEEELRFLDAHPGF